MNKEDIQKLASLSRLKLSEANIEKMPQEVDSILDFLGKLKEAKPEEKHLVIENSLANNVTRGDDNENPRGANKKKLVESAPNHTGEFIKVKKVL